MSDLGRAPGGDRAARTDELRTGDRASEPLARLARAARRLAPLVAGPDDVERDAASARRLHDLDLVEHRRRRVDPDVATRREAQRRVQRREVADAVVREGR